MEDNSILKLESMSILDKKSEEIVADIVKEQDSEQLKNLITLFNSNQSKKDIIRNNVFSILMDKISSQMLERFEKNPNAFSNKDLLEYLNTIKNVKSNKIDVDSIDMPLIQNNTQINVKVETLSRESKERVIDSVNAILNKLKNNNSIEEMQEVVDNENKNND
jgi:hypothetical protein